MKIVAVDNYDRDYVPEHVVEANLSPQDARKKCDELNARCGSHSPYWHVVRADDAKVRSYEDIY